LTLSLNGSIISRFIIYRGYGMKYRSALRSSKKAWVPNAVALQRGEATQVGDAAVSHAVALTKVKMLQRGEATQVGDAAVSHAVALTKVKVLLQRGEATQVGDAAVCHRSAS
jgi:hypothetical protein